MPIKHILTGKERRQRSTVHPDRWVYLVETKCGTWLSASANDDMGDECPLCNAAETTDSPSHYTETAIECIDAIRTTLGDDGFRQYCRGNAIKYAWRAGKKGNFEEDMTKCARFAMWAAGQDWRENVEED